MSIYFSNLLNLLFPFFLVSSIVVGFETIHENWFKKVCKSFLVTENSVNVLAISELIYSLLFWGFWFLDALDLLLQSLYPLDFFWWSKAASSRLLWLIILVRSLSQTHLNVCIYITQMPFFNYLSVLLEI